MRISVKLLSSSGFLLMSGLLMEILSRTHSAHSGWMQFIGWCFVICGAIPTLCTWGREVMALWETAMDKPTQAKEENGTK